MAFFCLILNGSCKVTRNEGKWDCVEPCICTFSLSAMEPWRIWSRNQICILGRLLRQKLPKKLPPRLRPRNICVPETSLSHQSVLPFMGAFIDWEHQLSPLCIAVLILSQLWPWFPHLVTQPLAFLLLFSHLLVRTNSDFRPKFNTPLTNSLHQFTLVDFFTLL